jgi:predicted  nucleic acid-binding Zn-ribbon protein
VAAVFGPAAPKFIDFLASTFTLQKEDVMKVSALSFEKTLQTEVSKLHVEMGELRSETRTAIAEVRTEIADLRSETRTAIAEVRTEIADLRSETGTAIAEVRTEIADLRSETRTAIAGLRTETAELRSEMVAMKAELKSEFKSDIAILHRDNVVMTRWMLVAVLGGATLFPIVDKILNRLF